MAFSLRTWISQCANAFGPSTRWGVEVLVDEIRLVRLDRRWNGWALGRFISCANASKATIDLNVRLNGYRMAASTMSSWIAPIAQPLPESEESAGFESCEEPRETPRWRMLWCPGEVESILAANAPLDDPDEVVATPTLPTELLTSCPAGPWVGCRFLSNECAVWLLQGDAIQSYFRLNGGWNDEPLFLSEWKQVFEEEIPRYWPAFSNAPIASLECGDHTRLREFLGDQTILATPEWKPAFKAIPESARIASAAALGYGTSIVSSIDGILSEDARGRQKLAIGSLIGLFGLSCCLMILTGLRFAELRLQRGLERQKSALILPDSVWKLWQIDQDKRHRMDALHLRKEHSGGSLATLWTNASGCLPDQLWVVRWDGRRDSSRWTTSMKTFHPSDIPSNWATCIQGKAQATGFAIRTGQTVSPMEWGSTTTLPANLTATEASNEGIQ